MKSKKTKKTIAVDVDDVLAASAEGFVTFSNKKWGTRLTVEDYDERWAIMWNVSHEEEKERAHTIHSEGIVKDFVHFPEAKDALQRLAEQYWLVVTTSRANHVKEYTKEWLDRYFGGLFEEVHHTGFYDSLHSGAHKLTKADLCRSIGADYLIDDQPKHCFASAEVGIPSLLFGVYPWSRDIKQLPKDVERVKDWQEVLDYFDGIA